MANTPTAAQKRHFGRVAALGCRACAILGYGDDCECEIHHVQDGMFGKRDHDKIIGLCPRHHRNGKFAVHNMSADEWLAYTGKTELEMLADTRRELNIVL